MSLLEFTQAGQAGNSLLITGAGDSDTGGGLCVFDGAHLEVIDRVSSSGMAVFDGKLARLLRAPLSTGGGEIVVYDHRGILNYLRIDELSDAHYLTWDGEHLVIASTGTNSIVWVSLGGKVVRETRFPGEDDSWHLNDVYLFEGRLHASALGKYSYYREYKEHLSRADGIVFDYASGDVVVAGLQGPHSPRYFDGAWTVCEALRNSIVQVDAETGERVREVKLKAFTRGMAVTDDYVIVGESVNRKSQNGTPKGSVAILRRSDFELVHRFDVPFREVSDIAVTPETLVNGTKVGFRTNLMRVQESDQLQMFRDLGIEPKRLWAVSDPLTRSQCRARISAKFPERLICGRITLIDCTVTNRSESFFCSELPQPVRISYRWLNVRDSQPAVVTEGLRTRLPATLPPGASVSLRIDVLAPDSAGEFDLWITLLQEDNTWFDLVDSSNACSARVIVAPAES